MLGLQKPKEEAYPGSVSAAPHRTPEKTIILPVAPADFESPEIRAVYSVWDEKRGERPMPMRSEILPRPLARQLRFISIVRVIPETNDYELRVIGDAHAEAYGWNGQGLRISQLAASGNVMGEMLRDSYELVRTFRRPLGFRGILGRDITQARFDWFETLYLPLGSGGVIDHILNASTYRPKDGKWPQ